jgi:hypothetical protein
VILQVSNKNRFRYYVLNYFYKKFYFQLQSTIFQVSRLVVWKKNRRFEVNYPNMYSSEMSCSFRHTRGHKGYERILHSYRRDNFELILSRVYVLICEWFIDHLYKRLVRTSNYSATANLHNSQISISHAKPFPACYVLTSRSLATASNSGDSSASRARILFSQIPVEKS